MGTAQGEKKMKQIFTTMVAVFLMIISFTGCLPEQTVVDAGGSPEKSGEIIITGSLLVTEAEIEAGMELQEKELKGAGGVYAPLTPAQWTDIINGKAIQVQYVEVRMSDDGGEVYNGIFPVTNGGFNVLIKNFPAGTYSVNVFFMNDSINQSIFYASNELVDVWPNQPTNVDLVAYLNNYCQKVIRLIGVDPQIAEMTSRATIIIGDNDIVGDVYWFSEEPMVMDIVFRNNLTFDFIQPSPMVFTDGNREYLGGMLLQNVDPVSLTDWATLTYVPINTSDIAINFTVAPPLGVL